MLKDEGQRALNEKREHDDGDEHFEEPVIVQVKEVGVHQQIPSRPYRGWVFVGGLHTLQDLEPRLTASFKVVAIFLNGLPLGMVWGLVVWYLEGRRTSELLLAGLSCSYILASGIVKDFARAMMTGMVADWWREIPLIGSAIGGMLGRVSEGWMPAITGLHFLPLFLLSVWMLNQLPRPTDADVLARVQRKPMDGSERLAFIKHFLFGLVLLCLSYFFLTAYRDFRDNYQVELFDGLGYPYEQNKAIITKAETIVMFGVIGAMALLNLIKDNRRGLIGAFCIMVRNSFRTPSGKPTGLYPKS
jgi:hypothetical protein